MPLLAAANLTYAVGDRVLLDGASLSIEAGERVGLVGRNGTGKSTLMRILGGMLKADSGEVSLQRGRRAGYLRQEPEFASGETLRGEAESAFAHLHALHRRLDAIYEALADSVSAKPEAMERLLAEQSRVERDMEAAGGYAVGHRIDEVLHGLGLTDAEFGVRVESLSGGQRARLALAKLLLESPDLIMLDEPTNHLDIAGREWLETFLAEEYQGAVLIVTHDRYMLDRVVSRIVEIEQGRLIDYPGNYAAFIELRARRRLSMQRAYERQQTKFRHEEAYIRRYKAGQRAKQARGRETRLIREKAESSVERPAELSVFDLELPKAPRTGELVVVLRGASKAYDIALDDDAESAHGRPQRRLFMNLDLTIGRGERWGIIGPNGSGKTTLIRAVLGEIPLDAGTCRIGTNVVVGHFRQVDQDTNPDQPVYRFLQDAIRRENPELSLSEQAARNLAGAFLFTGDDQGKDMGVLSGGERARARLAALLASGKNLLILDEPTNHLDIPSAERLEAALRRPEDGGCYEHTLILISHDRALIDATCDHLLILDGEGEAKVFVGDYSQWIEREQAQYVEAATNRTDKREVSAPDTSSRDAAKKPTANPLSWMNLEQVEAAMEAVSAEVKACDAKLAEPEVYSDAASCARVLETRSKAAERLAHLETEWLRRMEA